MMNTRTLLIYLRDALLAARQAKDVERIHDLMLVYSTIAEAAYSAENRVTAGMMEDLAASARDSLMGVEWKSEIPTNEDIDRETATENPMSCEKVLLHLKKHLRLATETDDEDELHYLGLVFVELEEVVARSQSEFEKSPQCRAN